MNASIKLFRALLWKQYRETRWLLFAASITLLILFILFFRANFPFQSPDAFEHSNLADVLIALWNSFFTWCGCFVAAALLIPVFAVEMERKTAGYLATKPLSSGWNEFSVLLASILIGLFAISLLIIATFLITYPTVSRFKTLYEMLFYPKLFSTFLGTAALTFYSFGCFCLFVSTCSSTRIRSLGLVILGLLAGGGWMLAISLFACETLKPENTLYQFMAFLVYGFQVAPVFILTTGCSLFIPIGLYIYRVKVLSNPRFWQPYAAAFSILLVLLVSIYWRDATDRNVFPARINPDSLGPETQQFVREIAGKRSLDAFSLFRPAKVARGDYTAEIRGQKGYPQPDQTRDPVCLSIEKFVGLPEQTTLFNRSVVDCFSEENLKVLAINPRDALFLNRDCWTITIAESRGLLSGVIQYPPQVLRKDKDDNFNYAPATDWSDWFFLGSFTLGDEVSFSPIERCSIQYIGINGKETQILECVKPGIFSKKELLKKTQSIDKEITRFSRENSNRSDSKIQSATRELSQFAYLYHTALTFNYLPSFFIDPSQSAQSRNRIYEHSREYNRFFVNDSLHRCWLTITCYDLSDPKTLAIYYKSIPENTDIDQYSYMAAVDRDRFLCLANGTAIFYDVSQPGDMREIGRSPLPDWQKMKTRFTGSNILLKDRNVLLQTRYGIYLYELRDDCSLRLIARKTNRLNAFYSPWSYRIESRITDGRLSLFQISLHSSSIPDRFEQYAIGAAPVEEPNLPAYPYLTMGVDGKLKAPAEKR